MLQRWLAGFLLMFTSTWLIAQPVGSSKPNVIIVLADDLGYGDVSALNPYARTKTPNIDELVNNGINFSDAHSAGAVCTPSRYGILTGRYYFRVPKHAEYMGYLKPIIDSGQQTIGTLMQRAGYETACIGKWHLGLSWGLKDPSLPQIPNGNKTITNTDFAKAVNDGPTSRGFNYSYILPASLDMPPYAFVKNKTVIDPNMVLTANVYPKRLDSTKVVWDGKYTNSDDVYWERGVWWRNGEMSRTFKMEDCFDTIVNQGISFINQHVKNKPDQPFMLYLPLTGPHTPWLVNQHFKNKTSLGTYGDFVMQVDNVVGQINMTLKTLGISENTIIIFASDNGAPWAEEDIQVYDHRSNAGRRGQKGDIYDGGHHIPLIVTWPARIKKPSVHTATVGLIDMFATFAEMTGETLTKADGPDSFSFLKVLTGAGNDETRGDILYESSRGKLAIKRGDWKYIDCLGSGGFTEPAVIAPVENGITGQLYNLTNDPLESNNLYLEHPEKVKELKTLLSKYVQQGYTRN